MESSDTLPLDTEDAQRGSQQCYSTRRVDTGQRLVDRMPINPKIAVFESTQERFEVPLRPNMWPSHAVSGGPGSSSHMQPDSSFVRNSNVHHGHTGDLMEDVHGRGRKKVACRKANEFANRTVHDVHRKKKSRSSSHLSSKEKSKASENSRRLTDYFATHEGTVFKRQSSIRHGVVHLDKDGLDDMPNVHQIRVPRLRDLLSRPLARLSGQPLEAILGVFDQFDLTLSENTTAIQASINNIVRAPVHLAEKFWPVIDLIAAQTMSADPNINCESSRRSSYGHEGDVVDAHTVLEHSPSATGAPSTDNRHHINSEDFIPNSSPACQIGDLSPVSAAHHDNPVGNHPSPSNVRTTSGNSNMDLETHEAANQSHIGTVYLPPLTAGKRFTRKPNKFCSPFKYGVMTRPPPSVDASLNLLDRLCADDSMYKSTTMIQYGTTPLTGAFIARSFADAALADSVFMSFFVKCLRYDDYWIRPECFGYRIFLDPEVSAILNIEWTKRDSIEPKYSHFAAVAAIQLCLPFTNLKKTKMILLPVLHQHHWSVYCVNFNQSRIDVLDSMDYETNNYHSWDTFHLDMGKKIIHRLSDALSEAAPHKFKCFKNWRQVKVQVPIHKTSSDSIFFAMKFIEYYDGEGHGSLKTNFDNGGSKELRAEMLYYITFHSENKVLNMMLDDLLQFRQIDHHPFFY